MNLRAYNWIVLTLAGVMAPSVQATIITAEEASPAFPTTFVFPSIPSNSALDFANGLSFSLLAGTQNGSRLPNLTNGIGQSTSDDPTNSFFAQDGSNVRIQVDLGGTYTIDQVNTYSWHPGVRAPQFYQLYGAAAPSNNAPNYGDAGFRDDSALGLLGYTLIGSVDTRSFGGGQHGVSIHGDIGDFRYLLFEISQANTTNGSDGNRGTFFGEIDIHVVPEPSSLALLGCAGLGLLTRRRKTR